MPPLIVLLDYHFVPAAVDVHHIDARCELVGIVASVQRHLLHGAVDGHDLRRHGLLRHDVKHIAVGPHTVAGGRQVVDARDIVDRCRCAGCIVCLRIVVGQDDVVKRDLRFIGQGAIGRDGEVDDARIPE